MKGMTPPPEMVALISISNSSSHLMASYKCLWAILLTFKSFDSFPASSMASAVKYSKIVAAYTAALASTRFLSVTLLFSIR